MECESLLYRTEIPSLRLTFGRASRGHWYIVDNEYCILSTDGWSVGDDHTGVREHAAGMHPRFQG